MKKLVGLSLIAIIQISPALAVAAPTAELKLVGKISPVACSPMFSTGSTIDYGTLPASTLSATEPTRLPVHTSQFAVFCGPAVKIVIRVQDERSATTVSSLETMPGYGSAEKLGLGVADNGANIGAYSLEYINLAVPQGQQGSPVYSPDAGVTWAPIAAGGLKVDGGLYAMAENASATTPHAYNSVTLTYKVHALIDKTANLPITDEIKIDGLATFEVIYL